jgi:hypothetical protein
MDRLTADPRIPARYREMVDRLTAHAAVDPDIRACWAGGSLAFGHADHESDLDIELLAMAGAGVSAFARLRDMLLAVYAPTSEWLIPTPAWHGGHQTFLHLPRADDGRRILDVVVREASGDRHPIDPRRDGEPIVLYDPDGLVVVAPLDPDTLAQQITSALETIAARRSTAEWIITKALVREQWPEAVAYYVQLGLVPLVALLRVRHCPWRHDFGLRYLDHDLPADVATKVESLLPTGVEHLSELTVRCLAWQDELLAGGEPGQGSTLLA